MIVTLELGRQGQLVIEGVEDVEHFDDRVEIKRAGSSYVVPYTKLFWIKIDGGPTHQQRLAEVMTVPGRPEQRYTVDVVDREPS